MKVKIPNIANIAGRDPNTWLALSFLFVALIVPAGAVLWYMGDAARAQAESARLSVLEVYRGQLRFLRDRVDERLKAHADALASSESDVLSALRSGMADAILVTNANGSLRFPEPPQGPAPDPIANRSDWRAASTVEDRGAWALAARAYAAIAETKDVYLRSRAVQAEVRSLIRAGEREQAIRRILDTFQGRDRTPGRSIAGDELLLAVQLLSKQDPRRTAALQRLTTLLNDYRIPMPGAQRLFLMREVLAAGGGPFPSFEAENLAAEFLEMERPRVSAPGLQATSLAGVWKLGAGRVLALFRTETVQRLAAEAMREYGSSGVQFAAALPGATVPGEAIAAGSMLPGWQLSFQLSDTKLMEEAARKQQRAYLLIGYLAIFTIAAAGLLAARSVRKQMRLARMKTDLVAAVSHELKTPAASIRLLVDSLLDDSELDPVKTREYLALISSENLRLTRLIENFLTFARIERQRQPFAFAMIHPADVVHDAVRAVKDRFAQADCDLRIVIEPNLPPVRADQGAMVSVLVNLLENAYKYTPRDRRIEVRAFSEGGRVLFSVTDNGLGIAARDQRRIFREFYQVDQKLTRETGGCGLGLSIVDRIVRAHGGEVMVRSKPSEGSTFSVALAAA